MRTSVVNEGASREECLETCPVPPKGVLEGPHLVGLDVLKAGREKKWGEKSGERKRVRRSGDEWREKKRRDENVSMMMIKNRPPKCLSKTQSGQSPQSFSIIVRSVIHFHVFTFFRLLCFRVFTFLCF